MQPNKTSPHCFSSFPHAWHNSTVVSFHGYSPWWHSFTTGVKVCRNCTINGIVLAWGPWLDSGVTFVYKVYIQVTQSTGWGWSGVGLSILHWGIWLLNNRGPNFTSVAAADIQFIHYNSQMKLGPILYVFKGSMVYFLVHFLQNLENKIIVSYLRGSKVNVGWKTLYNITVRRKGAGIRIVYWLTF